MIVSSYCIGIYFIKTLTKKYGKHLNLLPIRPHRISAKSNNTIDWQMQSIATYKHYMSTVFALETRNAVEIKLVARFSQ